MQIKEALIQSKIILRRVRVSIKLNLASKLLLVTNPKQYLSRKIAIMIIQIPIKMSEKQLQAIILTIQV